MSIAVQLQGLPELAELLKDVDDKMRKRELKRVISHGANIIREAIRGEAPVSKRGGYYDKEKRAAGNLKKSVGVRWNKKQRTEKVIAYIGANKVKGVDAFYHHMVISGTQPHLIPFHNKSIQGRTQKTMNFSIAGREVTVTRVQHPGAAPNDFVSKGFAQGQAAAAAVISDKAAKAIKRLSKKMGRR